MSAAFDQQRLLHENEIVQLLHNYKCNGVNQSRLRNPLQSSVKNVRTITLKRTVYFYPLFKVVTSLTSLARLTS